MRTVELGVTITDAAIDGDATVVICDLLDDGRRHCPGCGSEGVYLTATGPGNPLIQSRTSR